MSTVSSEVTESKFEKLIDKAFIEWLIDDLLPDELLFILTGLDMEIRKVKGKNPPKLFLKNKLLIKTTRIKLRDTEALPPFKWFLEFEGEMTKEDILEIANKSNVPKREEALSLFLQNHYREAFQIYENRNIEDTVGQVFVEKVETEVQKEVVQENGLSAKVEKKLKQKLLNSEAERDKLLTQLKVQQQEMKDKLNAKQSEINRLNGLLINEKNKIETQKEKTLTNVEITALQQEAEEKLLVKQNEINRLNGLLINEKNKIETVREKVIAEVEMEKEMLIKEVNFLKEENDQIKLKNKDSLSNKKETSIEKAKLALLGDPKNKNILKNDKFKIEVFDHESFEEILDREKEFESIYLLSWRFSVEEFETRSNSEISKKTVLINSFTDLRKKLEELTNVN